jgi:hypothetical protein
MNLLPVSVLVIFSFRRSFLQVIRGNSLMKFAFLMLIVHFPVYWLPPGGRQRYIIMLYPFIVQILAYFYLGYFSEDVRKTRVFSIIVTSALGLAAIACLVPLLVDRMYFIPYLLHVCLLCFTVMTAIFILNLKKPRYSIITLLYAMVILRIFFALTILPVRATEGAAPANRQAALDIVRITEGKPVCILRPTYFPMQSVFYFEKERMEILPLCSEAVPGKYHIVQEIILLDYKFCREFNSLESNPRHPFSDPYSRDDQITLEGYHYETSLAFKLQKRNYLLLVPTDN